MFSIKNILGLSLIAACMFSASAMSVTPSNTNNIVGTWVNTNASTRGTVKIVVSKVGSNLRFKSYGSCSPTPCVHSTVSAYPFSPSVSSNYANSFTAYRNSGFKTTRYDAMREYGHGIGSFMRMNQFSTFASGDSRKNYGSTELFKKQGVLIIPGIFEISL